MNEAQILSLIESIAEKAQDAFDKHLSITEFYDFVDSQKDLVYLKFKKYSNKTTSGKTL